MDKRTDEEIIASLGIGRTFSRGRKRRPARAVQPAAAPRLRWTDSDNLHGVEARVVGGYYDGLRVVVRQKGVQIRYPDVFDLSGYDFDPESWTFRARAAA